eukprot:10377558-Ditylum_brightwellii.AAC.2
MRTTLLLLTYPSSSWLTLDLSTLVLFFPDDETRRGYVPVYPVTATWYNPSRTPGQYNKHTHPMFPLRFAWAWTIWKTQGQTIVGE